MHGADSLPAGGMTYTVYIDQVFAVNVLMDLLVLAAAGRLLGYRTRRIRLLAGAPAGRRLVSGRTFLAGEHGAGGVYHLCPSERTHGGGSLSCT